MESDPIGLEGGLNTYTYALANPIKYFDSDGLEVRFICRLVGGGIGDLTGKKHCFVYVDCPEENWSAILTLFGHDFTYSGRKQMMVPNTTGWSNWPDKPDAPGNTDDVTITPKEQKCGTCEYERRVLDAYYSFPGGDVPYGVFGPNSNTFAQHLINRSGGSFGGDAIRNAPGMRR